MRTYFDNEINSLRREILALKQAKAKTISQMKFKAITIPNIQLNGSDSRVFKVVPQNDVFPLLTARVEFVSGDIQNSWINSGWTYYNNYYRFSVSVLSNSPVLNPTVNVVFTSTSELTIEEV